MGEIEQVFKAYDIRGTVPEQLDADLCERIGAAFARFCGPDTAQVVLARDMRPSGVALAAAFAEGVQQQGVDVLDVGLASTDMLYFASGKLNAPGAMLTASHNPAEYNGLKLCGAGAAPIGEDSGLQQVKALVADGLVPAADRGLLRSTALLDDFADHVCSFVDTGGLRPLQVVADTANGMGGHVLPAVFERLPMRLEILYPELDGTFPNHPADPLQAENLRDLQERVLATGADIGLAFDGDADRVFVVDEQARPLSGSLTTALVASRVLKEEPGATIIHNLICSKAVPEMVTERGGVALRSRVGHSYIKQLMAETGAAFGGEHSGHYYFRDNYRADSGLIASVILLEMLGRFDGRLSQLAAPYERYASSGEINTSVADPAAVLSDVAQAYRHAPQDRLDGLTVDLDDWWFNLRPSNTEPLLRLNLEAADPETVRRRVAEVQRHMGP